MIKAARIGKDAQKARVQPDSTLELARRVLEIEADAVRALIERVDQRFAAAVELINKRKGRVVVSGMGKSGHIARKVASTLASTGTPAYFVHPAEASHGDLGMIENGDVFIAISYSGASEELVQIVPQIKRRGAKLIAITGKPDSALAREADVHLDAAVAQEACPHNLAPTASTTAALALGDALAVALLDMRGFSAADFARTHPRGGLPGQALARQALLHVEDVMRTGDQLPFVSPDTPLKDGLLEMSRKGLGMTAIVDERRRVLGIYTDGDLRRTLDRPVDIRTLSMREVMTPNPKTIRARVLAAEAVHLMETSRITQLLVVDADNVLVGALNVHDLFRAGVM
jgi:arabinose-5-phosphate isomerase